MEGSQGKGSEGSVKVKSGCPAGFPIFNICLSLRNFLGFYHPLLKAAVTMVTATPSRWQDGSEYNLKQECTFQ